MPYVKRHSRTASNPCCGVRRFAATPRRDGEQRRGLAVFGGEVVLGETVEGLVRGGPGECAVGAVVIVEVDEPDVGVLAFAL